MFDIAKFDSRTRSEQGAEMVIRHPSTGTPMRDEAGATVSIVVFGRNSATYRKAEKEVRDRQLARTKADVQPTEQDIEDDRCDFLCAVTKEFRNFAKGGQPYESTPENIRAFWTDQSHAWLSRMTEAFVMAEGNFLPA